MARVYRARDTQLQRIVALKVLAAQLSMDAEFIKRFEREARTAANLRHPNIVTVYDIGEDQGLHYIAMEYIDGLPLHTILERHVVLGLAMRLPCSNQLPPLSIMPIRLALSIAISSRITLWLIAMAGWC